MSVIAQTADAIIKDSADQTVLIGPVVFAMSDGLATRAFSVVVVADRDRYFRINAHSPEQANALRLALVDALASRRTPCAVHAFESEIELAHAAEITWPRPIIARARTWMEGAMAAHDADSPR